LTNFERANILKKLALLLCVCFFYRVYCFIFQQVMNFSNKLVSWYQVNKRDLPWRNTANAYYIWLSEIILQQTRVAQGMPYYLSFVKAYPKIEDLANAPEDEVLKMWQGLGYYSRARNLHFTAKDIAANYGGKFPNDYQKILKLKGVGTYTAAAITSFAFDLPYAVVDGNVVRALSRIFGINTPFDTTIGKKQFKELTQELLIKENPSVYNQAIMEFGAMQCKPKSPDCSVCPMRDFCEAYNNNTIAELPVKSKKIKVKNRFLHFLMIEKCGKVYLGKRKSGIWQGLYEFPFLEFSDSINEKELLLSEAWADIFADKKVEIQSVSSEFIHVLSHQKIHAQFWEVKTNDINLKNYQLIAKEELENYPVSRLTEKYFETLKLT
jgi:A/G-specific adenine glycosylase